MQSSENHARALFSQALCWHEMQPVRLSGECTEQQPLCTGHAAAGCSLECPAHHSSSNYCRLQLLVLGGLSLPRCFRIFLYVLINYQKPHKMFSTCTLLLIPQEKPVRVHSAAHGEMWENNNFTKSSEEKNNTTILVLHLFLLFFNLMPDAF